MRHQTGNRERVMPISMLIKLFHRENASFVEQSIILRKIVLGNHQAIDDGKAAAPTVGKKDTSKKGGSINTQDEDKKDNSAASSGQREPCQICTQMGMRDWVTRTHSTKECRNAAKIAMKLLNGETIHGKMARKAHQTRESVNRPIKDWPKIVKVSQKRLCN